MAARLMGGSFGSLGRSPQHLYWIDAPKRVAGVLMTQVLMFADEPAPAL
jgi:hypothetical protein